jgi:hypothetical protein
MCIVLVLITPTLGRDPVGSFGNLAISGCVMAYLRLFATEGRRRVGIKIQENNRWPSGFGIVRGHYSLSVKQRTIHAEARRPCARDTPQLLARLPQQASTMTTLRCGGLILAPSAAPVEISALYHLTELVSTQTL